MVPEATRLWKPEIAPQAIVINKAGNKKPEAAALFTTALPVLGSMMVLPAASTATLETVKSVKAGICKLAASPVRLAPMMPITERAIIP